MSEKLPSDVKLGENADGTVSFATDVVATIAGLAANEVEGVASMPSASSGFADILTRKSSRNFTKGVKIDIDGQKVAVDVTIVVEYGSPVPDVARGIQENIKKAIETMSGLEVKNVDVHVQGVSFERENRAAAELEQQQQKMLEEEAQRKVGEKEDLKRASAPAEVTNAPVQATAESEAVAEETPTVPVDEDETVDDDFDLDLEDITDEELEDAIRLEEEDSEEE